MPDKPTPEPETVTISAKDRRLQHASATEIEIVTRRHELRGVRFEGDHAIATDGRILAVRRKTSTVKGDGATDACIVKFSDPGDASTLSCNLYKIGNRLVGVLSDTLASILEGRFPLWRGAAAIPKEPAKAIIAIDAERLLQLAKALCDDESTSVVLEVGSTGDPVFVKAYGDDSSFGVIMPLIYEGQEDKGTPREIAANLTAKPL